MNSKVYKTCVVPLCKNTSIKTPNKVFVYVPHQKEVRHKWLQLARRNPDTFSAYSRLHICEDHFDLPNDMENYMKYHLMGYVSQVKMKPGVLPRKFECQPDRRKRTTDKISRPARPYMLKKQRMMIIEEYEKQLNESSTVTELEDITSSESPLSHREIKEEAQPGPGPSNTTKKTNRKNTSCFLSSEPLQPRNTEQCCRFCGEFNQHCVPVCDVTYLSATTTLAFNHVTVHLDFRDDTLPSAVCPHCDIKLQQMYEFVKAVKDAQESLFNVVVKEMNDETNDVQEFESFIIKTEFEDEETIDDQEDSNMNEDSKDGILDSAGQAIFIKENDTQKRKTKTIRAKKPKKAKNTDKRVKEAKVKEKSKNKVTEFIIKEEEDKPFCIDIKIEREDTDAGNDEDVCNTESLVSDTGTVKPRTY